MSSQRGSGAGGRRQRGGQGAVGEREGERRAAEFGCDTADGTFLAFGPRKNLPRLMTWPGVEMKRQHAGPVRSLPCFGCKRTVIEPRAHEKCAA